MPRPHARVSIGLPVYNGERYLAATLDSLLAQTFDDFELFICDNASTDGTATIGRAYAAQDPRVRYVRHPENIGAARNFNRTFELASAEYFRWASADDLFAPQSLARCVEVLDREPSVVLAYPKTTLIDDDGRVIRPYEDGLHLQSPRPSDRFAQALYRLVLCNAQYGLMRTEVLKRVLPVGVYVGCDWVLLAELSLYGTFWEIPEHLFFRRMHAAASSSMSDAERRVFYDPNDSRRVVLHQWRHLWELARAVQRAPLDRLERIRSVGYLLRQARWQRYALAREAWSVVRALLGGSPA